MCEYDNPITRSIPFFMASILLFLILVFIEKFKLFKDANRKIMLVIKITVWLLATILLILGTLEYTTYVCI